MKCTQRCFALYHCSGILELQFNMLSDALPESLFNLVNLATFRVNDNMLVGTIPATVSQMVNLEEIWMNATSIGGALPESLYTLPKLANINLAGAGFSGTLSEGVAALSGLRFLQVQENSFSGPIPVGLDSLTRLSKWHVEECGWFDAHWHSDTDDYCLFSHRPNRRFIAAWKRPCRYDISCTLCKEGDQLFRSSKCNCRLCRQSTASVLPRRLL